MDRTDGLDDNDGLLFLAVLLRRGDIVLAVGIFGRSDSRERSHSVGGSLVFLEKADVLSCTVIASSSMECIRVLFALARMDSIE